MKTSKIFLLVLALIYLLSCRLLAQDINVHYMIGKKLSEVVKKYGNPIHQDKSNPAMICMFYKGDNFTMVFVGDNDGVYQAEASKSYSTEKEARSFADDFISKSISDSFTCDTVTVNDFKLSKAGVKATLQLMKNEITKKIDINVKANKSES